MGMFSHRCIVITACILLAPNCQAATCGTLSALTEEELDLLEEGEVTAMDMRLLQRKVAVVSATRFIASNSASSSTGDVVEADVGKAVLADAAVLLQTGVETLPVAADHGPPPVIKPVS